MYTNLSHLLWVQILPKKWCYLADLKGNFLRINIISRLYALNVRITSYF